MAITLYENELSYNDAAPGGNPQVAEFLTESWYPLPAVIVLPGGAYRNHAAHEAEPIAEFYKSCGFHAFVLRYRLLPNLYPAALCDVQRLIKYLRANATQLKVDPDKIFVLGFSAGGHLAANSAVAEDVCRLGDGLDEQNHRPNGVLLCYPVVNTGHSCVVNIAGGDAAVCEKLCIDKRITDDTPPMFIWHTAEDATVSVQQSLSLASALREHKIPFQLHVFPHGSHGLGLARHLPEISVWAELSAQWIRSVCNV